MPEVHTCTCGGQKWTMHDATITCVNCGKICGLIWPEAEVHIESSGEFNERIKQEEHGGLVAEPEPPFTKKLISEEK